MKNVIVIIAGMKMMLTVEKVLIFAMGKVNQFTIVQTLLVFTN